MFLFTETLCYADPQRHSNSNFYLEVWFFQKVITSYFKILQKSYSWHLIPALHSQFSSWMHFPYGYRNATHSRCTSWESYTVVLHTVWVALHHRALSTKDADYTLDFGLWLSLQGTENRQRETHLFDLPAGQIMKLLHQFLLQLGVAILPVDTHTPSSSVSGQAAARAVFTL